MRRKKDSQEFSTAGNDAFDNYVIYQQKIIGFRNGFANIYREVNNVYHLKLLSLTSSHWAAALPVYRCSTDLHSMDPYEDVNITK